MAGVSERQPRPRHTTLATALIIGGSVGVVISVAEQLSGLYSLDTRRVVTSFLDAPPGSDLGLDVTQTLSLMRVLLMVLAGCATAAIVLGWHAMQGSAKARLGLTGLAPVILLTGVTTGGFLPSLVAAGTAILWSGPSAYWFRGEPVPEPPKPQQREQPRQEPRQPPPLPQRPPPHLEHRPQGTLTAYPPPVAQHQPSHYPPPVPRRPDALVWACVLTWAFCSLTVLVMGASAVVMGTNPDVVLDEVRRQNAGLADQDPALFTEAVYVTAAIASAWSVAASVLAVLAYRGVPWARVGLLSSAAVAGVICLLGIFSSIVLVVPAAATLATVGLLTRPDVKAWFARG